MKYPFAFTSFGSSASHGQNVYSRHGYLCTPVRAASTVPQTPAWFQGCVCSELCDCVEGFAFRSGCRYRLSTLSTVESKQRGTRARSFERDAPSLGLRLTLCPGFSIALLLCETDNLCLHVETFILETPHLNRCLMPHEKHFASLAISVSFFVHCWHLVQRQDNNKKRHLPKYDPMDMSQTKS